MRYDYECESCGIIEEVEAKAFHPPESVNCPECEEPMDRIFGCAIDTSKCRDVDEIPPQHRVSVSQGRISDRQAHRVEKAYADDIKRKRDQAGKGAMMECSIPAPMYHGKIRETGDRNYWKDPDNRKRHKSCQIKRRK